VHKLKNKTGEEEEKKDNEMQDEVLNQSGLGHIKTNKEYKIHNSRIDVLKLYNRETKLRQLGRKKYKQREQIKPVTHSKSLKVNPLCIHCHQTGCVKASFFFF
jgi:hypothetical protein